MSRRRHSPITLAMSASLLASLVLTPAAGQLTQDGGYVPGRTAWGDPDLQGVYTFATSTPLERPEALGDKATYSEEELAALEEAVAQQMASDQIGYDEGGVPPYNTTWVLNEQGRAAERTSLIVNPQNGRLPPLTEAGERVRDELAAELAARTVEGPTQNYTIYDTWLDHLPYTRCVARPMPRIGAAYNHGMQILQTPGYVVIYYESMHDTRIIPLDGRAPIPSSMRQWNGDARGHWEDDTLVVDWRNFTDKIEFEGFPQGGMRFVERLTKVDANTINYEVTVHAPEIWAQPWTLALPWRADDPNYQTPVDLYEFACHEGNYRMMRNTLEGSQALREARGEFE